jgi:hypothetical protein
VRVRVRLRVRVGVCKDEGEGEGGGVGEGEDPNLPMPPVQRRIGLFQLPAICIPHECVFRPLVTAAGCQSLRWVQNRSSYCLASSTQQGGIDLIFYTKMKTQKGKKKRRDETTRKTRGERRGDERRRDETRREETRREETK